MNAHSSPIGLRQNALRLRSVIMGKPLARSNRMTCCSRVIAAGPWRVGHPGAAGQDALEQLAVLRVGLALAQR